MAFDTDIVDGQKVWRPVETAAAEGKDGAKRAEHDQIAELQRLLEFRIAELTRIAGSPMPPEIASQIQSMRAAIAGGNLTTLALIYNQTSAIQSDIAEDQAERAAYFSSVAHLSAIYPGYGEYSREGQRFIANEVAQAVESSPEFRELTERYDAMPQAERESAQAEQSSNQKVIGELLKDDTFKDVHEHLRIMRGTGMANGADAQELLTKLKNGEISADEFKQHVTDGVAKIAAKNDKFINDHVNSKHVEKETRDVLMAEFGVDGKIDSNKLTTEWGKIRLKDRDAAYKAIAAANGDISKLSPEHQRIVHMAQVMVAAETKTTIEGAMNIMARNQDLAKQLTDPSLSVEEKVKLLEAEEKRQGTYQANGFHNQALKQTVLAINESVSEGAVYDPKNPTSFLKKVGSEVQENYDDLLKQRPKPQAVQADVRREDNKIDAAAATAAAAAAANTTGSTTEPVVDNKYQDFAYYAAISNSDYSSSWKSPEQQAAERAQWQAFEDRIATAYTEEQAAMAISTIPVKTEAEKAADAALLASNPVKAYYDQLAAEQKTAGENGTTAAQSTANGVAATTTTPANQTTSAEGTNVSTPQAPASTIALPAGIEIPPLKGVTAVAEPNATEKTEPTGHLVVGAKTAQEAISQGA